MEMQKIAAACAVPAHFDLFAVEGSSVDHLGKKGRAATDREVLAYVNWLRRRANLPDHGKIKLHWHPIGRDRICIGATFGEELTGAGNPRPWSEWSYSVVMPGANQLRATVTMETLDEAGEIVASSTLPVEPKKGGVVWSREAIRDAHGPAPKLKARRKPAPRAAQAQPATLAALTSAVTPEIAPSGPGIEPQHHPEPVANVTADILARLATLEASLATLSAERVEAPSGGIQDTPAVERPKRTPAHERAVRRAWAERQARRTSERALTETLRAEGGRIGRLQAQLLQRSRQLEEERQHAREKRARALALARRHWTMRLVGRQQRRDLESELKAVRAARYRVADIGRGLALKARSERERLRQRVAVLEGESSRLKADMADSSQPERASDIARLVKERDEARTALAAVTARAERAEDARDKLADAVESLAGRVARAERSVRELQAA